jgi:hypothetical protein
MPDRKFAIVVASPRARTGKTLLARLLVEHFVLAGHEPLIFDTDAVERTLAACFPGRARVIDLDRVTDQMKLFDTLVAPAAETQVIDLTHRSFQKFFRLLRDIEYVAEARSRGIEPVIFFIPERDAESWTQALTIRDFFRDARFVLVEQTFLGEPARETRASPAYDTLKTHWPRVRLPRLDPFHAGAVDDPGLSLSEFVRRAGAKHASAPADGAISLVYLSREARVEISAWLNAALKDIKRVLDEIEAQAEAFSRDPLDG